MRPAAALSLQLGPGPHPSAAHCRAGYLPPFPATVVMTSMIPARRSAEFAIRPRSLRQIRMSAVVGGDGKAEVGSARARLG
jgi:hypothetical protein